MFAYIVRRILLSMFTIWAISLLAFGLEPQRWLESEGWAMICVVVPTVWAGVGAACLIYLAALKMVEESLYEAAAIDGAGLWSKLRHITLPSLQALVSSEERRVGTECRSRGSPPH